MKTLVLYHADCVDGFTAAWAAYTLFRGDAEYVAVRYTEHAPDVTGRDVWVLDFAYPRAELLAMKERAKTLRVLDHHKTHAEELEGLDFSLFDLDRSGAGLAWDILRPDTPRPMVVDYVEDRDLWRFRLPGSQAINALIGTWPRELDIFSSRSDWLEQIGREVAEELGQAVLAKIEQTVLLTAKDARVMMVDGHAVPVVNCSADTSEVVGALASRADFAVGWYQRADGRYAYSLRSRGEHGADVSAIALRRGGGGHPHAAGFESAERPDVLFGQPTKASEAP